MFRNILTIYKIIDVAYRCFTEPCSVRLLSIGINLAGKYATTTSFLEANPQPADAGKQVDKTKI